MEKTIKIIRGIEFHAGSSDFIIFDTSFIAGDCNLGGIAAGMVGHELL